MREKVSINLLSSCTNKELIKLEHFLGCKAYNSDKRILGLFKGIKSLIDRNLIYDEANESTIFHNLFDSEKNKKRTELNTKQKQKLNVLLTELTRLTEQFLCFEALEKNLADKSEILNRVLLLKRRHLLYKRHYNKQLKESDRNYKNIEFFKQSKNREKVYLDYLYQTGEIYEKDNLDELNELLDIEYLLQKLSLYGTVISMEEAVKRTYDKKSFKAIEPLLSLEKYDSLPEIIINRANIELLINNSEKNYHNLLELLDRYEDKISHEDLNSYYKGALNFCVRQIQKNKSTYNELFELFDTLNKKQLLVEHGVMELTKMKNLITVGCRVNNFSWAQKMIEKYIDYVRKDVRQEVYRYNLGVIEFYKKNYSEAINHFIYGDGINLSYDVNNRVMLMKSHYEVDKEYDERTLQIYRSTEKYFVTNKQLNKRNITAYKNFSRSLINLYRIKHRSTKMTIDSLKSKIEKQELNSDSKWLNDKIVEFEK